jgi:hypothetical protein
MALFLFREFVKEDAASNRSAFASSCPENTLQRRPGLSLPPDETEKEREKVSFFEPNYWAYFPCVAAWG